MKPIVRSFKFVWSAQKVIIDWRACLEKGLNTAAQVATEVINKTSSSVPGLAANVLITLFAMFFLFLDGKAFVERLNHLIPLRQEYTDLLFTRFLQISRATVSTCLIIGVIKGSLGALTFLMFGIKSWLLWGIVMVLLSIIPMLGAWVIMFPAAVIQVVIGNVWQGIGIFLPSAIVISNIDSFLRSRLVGKQARMHDLVVFFCDHWRHCGVRHNGFYHRTGDRRVVCDDHRYLQHGIQGVFGLSIFRISLTLTF